MDIFTKEEVDGVVHYFWIENSLIGRYGIARAIKEIDGVTNVRVKPYLFSKMLEYIHFTLDGVNFVVTQPFDYNCKLFSIEPADFDSPSPKLKRVLTTFEQLQYPRIIRLTNYLYGLPTLYLYIVLFNITRQINQTAIITLMLAFFLHGVWLIWSVR